MDQQNPNFVFFYKFTFSYVSMYGIGYYEEVYDVDDDGDQGVISMG